MQKLSIGFVGKRGVSFCSYRGTDLEKATEHRRSAVKMERGSRRIWWEISGAIMCQFPGCALQRSRRHNPLQSGV